MDGFIHLEIILLSFYVAITSEIQNNEGLCPQ